MDLATAHRIEESTLFFAQVTDVFMGQEQHKDEIAYARALGKPFALAVEKGVDPGNWFDGCNIISRINFDRDSFDEKQIADWLRGLHDSLKKK